MCCSNRELPGTPRKAESCLHSAAVELGSSCPGSRGKKSLELSPFLGIRRGRDFVVALDVTAGPSGTVSCLRAAS